MAKAQELVENFLKDFHKTKFPDKEPSGKDSDLINRVWNTCTALQTKISKRFCNSKILLLNYQMKIL